VASECSIGAGAFLDIGAGGVAELPGGEAAVGVPRRGPPDRARTRIAQPVPQLVIENTRPAGIDGAQLRSKLHERARRACSARLV
jgi:hypothetical protein